MLNSKFLPYALFWLRATLRACVALLFCWGGGAQAQSSGSGITYQGQIFKPSGSPLSGSVSFELEIYTPSPTSCLMYEEVQTATVASDGTFALTIDDGSGSRIDSSGYTLDQIFANQGTFSFTSGCSGSNTYTPDASDGRVLNVLFKGPGMSSYEAVGAQNINYIPMALTAKNVGGFTASNLLRFQESNGTMDSVSPLNNTQYNALVALVNGTSSLYVAANSNGAVLPSVSTAPSSPAAGTIWYNSSSGTLQYEAGSGVQTVGTSGGSVTSVASGAGLSGGPITSSGTLSLATIGAAGTGTKITYDTYGRVTASTTLSASDIPPLSTAGQVSGSTITSGTIAGSTALNTSGNLTTTGTLTAQSAIATNGDFNTLLIYKADNSDKVTITASNGQTSNYGLTLPTTAGTAGQILSTDGTGVLSWLTPSSGSVTSIAAGTGLSGGTITGAGTLSLASTGVNAGSYGSATQVPSLTVNAQGQITAASAVTISGVAPAGAASGDLSGTYPSPTVAKIQSVAVNSQTPLDGQYLKYLGAGSNYVPEYINFADLKSSAGLAQIPSTCTSSQTFAYQSPSDTFACVAISVSDSAITYTSKSANTFLAAPNGSAGTPSFRSIATADLGSGAASSSTYLRGDGTWASVPSSSAAGSNGQIQFNSSNAFAASPNLFWDNTNSRLGIGTTSANSTLEVNGAERFDGSTSGFVTLTAPAATTSYTLTLPTTAPSSNGQVLTGTTSGTLNWASSLTSALASGDLFVGNGSGVATAVAPSGDITMSNAGVFTVAKVDGVSYPSGATTVNTVPVITNANTITYETLPNAALANSSVTIGSTSVALGGTAASLAGLTSVTQGSSIYNNGSNSVTVTAPSSGVTAYTLTLPAIAPTASGQVLSATTAGVATWTTVSASASSFTGTLAVANGGTGQASALIQGGIVYGSSTTAMGTSAASTAANQVLVGETTGAPSFVTTTLSNTAMTFAGNGTVSTAGTLALLSNVGIGTTAPANALDIYSGNGIHIQSGTPSSTAAALYNSSGTLMWNGSAISGGTSSQWTTSGSNIYYATGGVGIGTTTQIGELNVAWKSGDLVPTATFGGGFFSGSGNNRTAVDASTESGYGVSGQSLTSYGVYGKSVYGSVGLYGESSNSGIQGYTSSTLSTGVGVWGSTSTSAVAGSSAVWAANQGAGYGISAASQHGTSAYFANQNNDAGIPVVIAQQYPGATGDIFQGRSSGTVLFNVTSAGNVGIGTTGPTAALNIKAGTSSLAPLQLTAGTNLTTPLSGAIEYDGTNLYYTDATATRHALGTSSSASQWTTSGSSIYYNSGSVGIGNTAPSALLHINGNGIAGYGTSAGGLILQANNPSWGVKLYEDTSSSFHMNVGGSERMIISAGGNVGIGNTNPSSALEVSGGAIVTDSVSSAASYINFGAGNTQMSSTAATTLNLCGMKDGGSYTLVLTGIAASSTVTVNAYPTYTSTSSCSGTAIQVDLGAGASTFTTAGNTNIISFVYFANRGSNGTIYGAPAVNYNY